MDFCIKLEKITNRTFALNWKIIDCKKNHSGRKKEKKKERRKK